ncbi:Cholecystokinin receptor [Nymphon striatum]|nr:Cholecystokinin receptor [Nymphon striatum]
MQRLVPIINEQSAVKTVIKMLVAVVVLFLVCWTPILMTNILTAYQFLPELNVGFTKPLRITFHLMAYFNSCINPVVYGFMSKNFRSSFKNAFSMVVRMDRRNRRTYSSFNNGTQQTTIISTAKSLAPPPSAAT